MLGLDIIAAQRSLTPLEVQLQFLESQNRKIMKMLVDPDWQPIETAPRDRNLKYIAYHPDWGIGIGEYTPSLGFYAHHILEGGSSGGQSPTNWMPLPEPPSKPLANSRKEHHRGGE